MTRDELEGEGEWGGWTCVLYLPLFLTSVFSYWCFRSPKSWMIHRVGMSVSRIVHVVILHISGVTETLNPLTSI